MVFAEELLVVSGSRWGGKCWGSDICTALLVHSGRSWQFSSARRDQHTYKSGSISGRCSRRRRFQAAVPSLTLTECLPHLQHLVQTASLTTREW